MCLKHKLNNSKKHSDIYLYSSRSSSTFSSFQIKLQHLFN
ncbi:unnamed protein product, partial [Callosobruchus maculatus]